MGWTAPVNQSTGYVVTATDWDNFLSGTAGNEIFLYGDAAWTNVPTFTGTWVAGASTPRYILIGRVVFLEGSLSSGTINTAAFTLPAGYRPSASVPVSSVSPAGAGGSWATFTVFSTGVVTPQVGSTTNFSIACSFTVA